MECFLSTHSTEAFTVQVYVNPLNFIKARIALAIPVKINISAYLLNPLFASLVAIRYKTKQLFQSCSKMHNVHH
jgi:hypothetical protein